MAQIPLLIHRQAIPEPTVLREPSVAGSPFSTNSTERKMVSYTQIFRSVLLSRLHCLSGALKTPAPPPSISIVTLFVAEKASFATVLRRLRADYPEEKYSAWSTRPKAKRPVLKNLRHKGTNLHAAAGD